MSPRQTEDIDSQRQNLKDAQQDRAEALNNLKTLDREIPSLARDTEFTIQKLSSSIKILSQ